MRLGAPGHSRILASSRSKTGWITVGEHKTQDMWFRYLRADHSLLGGLWIEPAKDQLLLDARWQRASPFELETEAVRVAESIYVGSQCTRKVPCYRAEIFKPPIVNVLVARGCQAGTSRA